MKEVTLSLSDETYQKLLEEAQRKQKSLEQFIVDHLFTEQPIISNPAQARTKAESILSTYAGKVLRAGDPEIHLSDHPIWKVPVVTNAEPPDAVVVGALLIDAFSAGVLTSTDELRQMLHAGLEALGLRHLAPDKHVRLSQLLGLQKERSLSDAETAELQTLLGEADTLDLENLQRIVEKISH